MSANLSTNTKTGEKAVMVIKESAWHKEGVILQDVATAAEALEHGGIDYTVEKRQLKIESPNGEFLDVPNRFAAVRTDNEMPLGLVSDRYEVLQNRDAFMFFEALADITKDDRIYHTAGAIGNGEFAWVQAKMPDHIAVGNDVTDMFVTLVNSFDGHSALRAYMTPIRVVCNNTLTASLSANKNKLMQSIGHYSNVKERLQEAAELMGFTNKYATAMNEALNHLHGKKIRSASIDKFLNVHVPYKFDKHGNIIESNMIDKRRETFMETLQTGVGQDVNRGSKYWLYNGYTRFLEDTKKSSVKSLMKGDIHNARNKAFQYLMQD